MFSDLNQCFVYRVKTMSLIQEREEQQKVSYYYKGS